MRRSTAAAVGTLTGAALIMGVRLSAFGAVPATAPVAIDQPQGLGSAKPRPAPTAASRGRDRNADNADQPAAEPTRRKTTAPSNGLRDGRFSGAPASNPYGRVQVAVTIADGKVVDAAASYPTAGQSASINAEAIPQLKQEVLAKQSAKIDAVSGATFTSEAYLKSLQAALDAARG
jgi:uncharacterized protein with FMN-binding domain